MSDWMRVLSVFLTSVACVGVDVTLRMTIAGYKRARLRPDRKIFQETLRQIAYSTEPLEYKPFDLLYGLTAVPALIVLVWNMPALIRICHTDFLMKIWLQQAGMTGCVVVFIGLMAYWLKTKRPVVYGAIEIIFGFASAYWNASITSKVQDIIVLRWVALGASVYVVSRGIGNIVDTRKNAKTKPEASGR